MKYLRLILLPAFVLTLGVGVSGCASTAAFLASTAASFSHNTPSQVTTLAQAVQVATLVTKAADVAVQTGKLDRPTLIEIGALSDALHSALQSLQAANSRGESLNYDAFNAALAAWNAYSTAKGISS